MTRYEISVGEPWDFEGPDGANRVLVDSDGVVQGPDQDYWQGPYLVLKVVSPFQYQGETVELLIAAPRYVGTTVEDLARRGGYAGFSRVRAATVLPRDRPFSPAHVHYFMIGELRHVQGAGG